jgi:excisionase family DNA binding protein
MMGGDLAGFPPRFYSAPCHLTGRFFGSNISSMRNALMSTAQVADLLGYTRRMVLYWVKDGRFPGAVQIGRAYVIPREDAEKLKAQLESSPARQRSGKTR